MMSIQPLDGLPLSATYLFTVLLLLLSLEAGYQLGKAKQKRWPDKSESGVSAMVGASLALLGFLLAFVTGIAIGVFNDRRQLVITEANAIGTTYLRAGFLAEPYQSELRQLLREYVDLRLAALNKEQTSQSIARSEEIHLELWSRAEVVGTESPNPVIAQYISSLNDVIDLHTMRINAELGFRVPPTIVLGLYFVAALTMVLVGLHSSYAEKRNLVSQIMMVLILSVIFLLIVDLDRSHQGLLRIPQDALLALQQQLNDVP